MITSYLTNRSINGGASATASTNPLVDQQKVVEAERVVKARVLNQLIKTGTVANVQPIAGSSLSSINQLTNNNVGGKLKVDCQCFSVSKSINSELCEQVSIVIDG
jgi:hypothetical protein